MNLLSFAWWWTVDVIMPSAETGCTEVFLLARKQMLQNRMIFVERTSITCISYVLIMTDFTF